MARQDNRPIGLTRDAGWQIGVRRALPLSHTEAWKLITSPTGIETWLGSVSDTVLSKREAYRLADGTTGQIRVFAPKSHLRVTWHPEGWPRPSIIQVRVIPKGEKTVIAFHQEHLPGPEEREERRAFFKAALDALEELSQAD